MATKVESRTVESATLSVVTPQIKDSLGVDRALGRSKLYLLMSWSMLYPEDDEFIDYLQSGEFVEDGRSSLESLTKALEGQGGVKAAQKLASIAKNFDLIERWVAAECSKWQLTDLQAEHRRVFSNVITLDCPPYETLFGNDHVFGQAHVMGDIAGYYKAFGVELSRDIHERLDHLSVELEFMHFLAYKESYARCHDGEDKTQIVIDAEKKFLKDHIGRWIPIFCRMLVRKADSGFFKLIADITADWVDFETTFWGVNPQPYSEADYRPATFLAPEGQIYECGAQDKGNELSVLLNEVGAQNFMDNKDKEKEDSGPVGTA
jgi:TorA maturation chaperone TorD